MSRLLKQYGLLEGADRPDLIVLDRAAHEAVAVVEVKYFASGESEGGDALRAAVNQLVRYARGYRDFEELDGLLDHSIAALVQVEAGRNPEPKPLGLPLVVDFKEIIERRLEEWSRRLIFSRALLLQAAKNA